MESAGVFFDEELDSLNRMFSNMNADNFMMQMHEYHDIVSNDRGNEMGFETSNLFPASEAIDNVSMASFYENLFSSNTIDTNSCSYFSPESSISSGNDNVFFTNPNNYEHNRANDVNILNAINNTSESSSMEFYVMDNKSTESSVVPVLSDDAMEDFLNVEEEMMINGNAKSGNGDCQAMAIVSSGKQQQLKRKINSPEDESSNDSSDNPKKKYRVLKDTQKSTRRNAQPKKNKKILRDGENDQDENETNAGQNLQSPSSSTSEDDSNASQELSGGETSDLKGSAAVKSNAKTRATRGSATDPQSLYARKRRERINERLKILQNLVPNGTKVDISTMLEEAVHYVKFLQLQIKLLSSDELWMYAPIAYNGMDIGVYQRMFPTL